MKHEDLENKGPEIYVGGESSAEQKPAKAESSSIYSKNNGLIAQDNPYIKILQEKTADNSLDDFYIQRKKYLASRLVPEARELYGEENFVSMSRELEQLEAAYSYFISSGGMLSEQPAEYSGISDIKYGTGSETSTKENLYLKIVKRAAEENRFEEWYNEEKSKLEERLKQLTEKDDKEGADSVREDIIMLEEACRIVKKTSAVSDKADGADLIKDKEKKFLCEIDTERTKIVKSGSGYVLWIEIKESQENLSKIYYLTSEVELDRHTVEKKIEYAKRYTADAYKSRGVITSRLDNFSVPVYLYVMGEYKHDGKIIYSEPSVFKIPKN